MTLAFQTFARHLRCSKSRGCGRKKEKLSVCLKTKASQGCMARCKVHERDSPLPNLSRSHPPEELHRSLAPVPPFHMFWVGLAALKIIGSAGFRIPADTGDQFRLVACRKVSKNTHQLLRHAVSLVGLAPKAFHCC